jgi:Uma2 family endonuclease
MAVIPRALTLQQFVELPEEEPPLEFADGVVTQKVSPKGQHSALQAELIKRLDQSGLPRKLARAFPELRATFAGASRVPDIAVYRWDRIPRDESGRIANDFFDPPDIAVEIVSPEQSVNALVRRCLWYVAHGVHVALLVDPVDESVLVFRSDGRVNAWHARDKIDLGEVLPDFELSVEELFAALH